MSSKKSKNKKSAANLEILLKKKTKEAREYLEGWQRERANFENFQKRLSRDIQAFRYEIFQQIASQLLPVLDAFREAELALTPKKKRDPWVKGVLQTVKQLEDALLKLGFRKFSFQAGDKFQPQFHEAVGGQGEYIDKIVQEGYEIGGTVVRPAKVIVKKK
jgi:molecular chaperone GrpE